MSLDLDPNHIFRDFVIDGMPASGANNPRKVEIRHLLTGIWQAVVALVADAGPELALPNLLIRYTVTGGTANAILASPNLTPPAGPGLALFSIQIAQANTGPVTINGKPLLTNGGQALLEGELVAGDLLLMLDAGESFRLANDPASWRNAQAAELAKTAAEDARSAAEVARDIAAGYASDIVSQGNVPIYASAIGMAEIEVPLGISAIRVNGRNAVGDGEGGLYVDEDTGSSDIFVSADARSWYRAADAGYFEPRPAAAPGFVRNVGDWMRQEKYLPNFAPSSSPSDWGSVLQTAYTEVAASGGTLRIPDGVYPMTGEPTLDLSAHGTTLNGKTVNVEGSGSGTCIFLVGANSTFITVEGEMAGGRGQNKICGIGCLPAPGATKSGNAALRLNRLSFSELEDFVSFALADGIITQDFISSILTRVHLRNGTRGMTMNGNVNLFSSNALGLYSCIFGNNDEYGALFREAGTVSLKNGSIEGNGRFGSNSQRWGLKIVNAGRASAVGLDIDGVYFENNPNMADIWIEHGPYPCAYKVMGSTFNRASGTYYPEHNIRVDQNAAAGDAYGILLTGGNGFRGYNDYVESASRRYVRILADGDFLHYDLGNLYNSSVADVNAPQATAFAKMSFDGTAGSPTVPNDALNIASITKNGTGDYTITFKRNPPSANYQAMVSVSGSSGYGCSFTQAAGSVRIRTNNSAGDLTDFSRVSMVIFK